MTWGKDMRKVHKIQKLIRSLHYHDRIFLMDWARAWYDDLKEQDRMEAEENEREEDECSCHDGEINIHCSWCY